MNNLPGDFELPVSALEILILEDFDLDSLRFATKEDLKEIGIKTGSILKIIAWQNSLRSSPKTKKAKSKSPNKTAKNTSPTTANSTSPTTANSTSPKSANAEPPQLFRQTTISDTLLRELVGDDGLRKIMDGIMLEGTEGATIGKNQIHLTNYSSFQYDDAGKRRIVWNYSDIKHHGNTLYYNWTNHSGSPYCHLSLKDDKAHPRRNSKARDIVGRFHLRWDLGGKNVYRRILVNDNNGVIELTRCSMKDQDIDEMTELVLRCIQQYYIETRGECNIVPGRC